MSLSIWSFSDSVTVSFVLALCCASTSNECCCHKTQYSGLQVLQSVPLPRVSIADGSRLWVAFIPCSSTLLHEEFLTPPPPPPHPPQKGTSGSVLALVNHSHSMDIHSLSVLDLCWDTTHTAIPVMSTCFAHVCWDVILCSCRLPCCLRVTIWMYQYSNCCISTSHMAGS